VFTGSERTRSFLTGVTIAPDFVGHYVGSCRQGTSGVRPIQTQRCRHRWLPAKSGPRLAWPARTHERAPHLLRCRQSRPTSKLSVSYLRLVVPCFLGAQGKDDVPGAQDAFQIVARPVGSSAKEVSRDTVLNEQLRAFEGSLLGRSPIAPTDFASVSKCGPVKVPVQAVRAGDVDAGEFLATNLACHVLHQRLDPALFIPRAPPRHAGRAMPGRRLSNRFTKQIRFAVSSAAPR